MTIPIASEPGNERPDLGTLMDRQRHYIRSMTLIAIGLGILFGVLGLLSEAPL